MGNKTKHLLFDDLGIHSIPTTIAKQPFTLFGNSVLLPTTHFIFKKDTVGAKKLSFWEMHSKVCQQNFELIDSQLPQILAAILLIALDSKKDLPLDEVLNILRTTNPLNYNLSYGHPIYEYKIHHFLACLIYGCSTITPWDGRYLKITNVVIKETNGNNIYCYIYNIKRFLDYLLGHLIISKPSPPINFSSNNSLKIINELVMLQLELKFV